LLATDIVAVSAAARNGVNTTEITHVPFGPIAAEHVSVSVKFAAFVPVNVIPETARFAVPVFVTVTVETPLAVSAGEVIVSDVPLSFSTGPVPLVVPVPASATYCGESPVLDVIPTYAFRAPAAVGVTATCTVQLASACSVAPQLFDSATSPAFTPDTAIPLSVTFALLLLVSVTVCALVGSPTAVDANVTLEGLTVITGVVDTSRIRQSGGGVESCG
jgi:hypothetical protein